MFASESAWATFKRMVKNRAQPEANPMKSCHDVEVAIRAVSSGQVHIGAELRSALKLPPNMGQHGDVLDLPSSLTVIGCGTYPALTDEEWWAIHMMHARTHVEYGKLWKDWPQWEEYSSKTLRRTIIIGFLNWCHSHGFLPARSLLMDHAKVYRAARVGALKMQVGSWFLAKPEYLHDDLDKNRTWFAQINAVMVHPSVVDMKPQLLFKVCCVPGT